MQRSQEQRGPLLAGSLSVDSPASTAKEGSQVKKFCPPKPPTPSTPDSSFVFTSSKCDATANVANQRTFRNRPLLTQEQLRRHGAGATNSSSLYTQPTTQTLPPASVIAARESIISPISSSSSHSETHNATKKSLLSSRVSSDSSPASSTTSCSPNPKAVTCGSILGISKLPGGLDGRTKGQRSFPSYNARGQREGPLMAPAKTIHAQYP